MARRLSVASACVAALCGSVQAADATTMFAFATAEYQALHSLDTVGPTSTPIGPVISTDDAIIAEIEYGGGVVYGADTNDNTLLHSIDPDTGLIYDTLIMTFPAEGDVITSLEFVGDVLYGGLTTEGRGPTYLSTIDLGTGVVSVVGPTGFDHPFGGLAYDGATMYGISAGGSPGELFRVDLATGTATSIGLIVVGGSGVRTTALEFGADGILYALPAVFPGPGPTPEPLANHLLSIDPNTAAGTDLGDTGYPLVALTTPEPSISWLLGVTGLLLWNRRSRPLRSRPACPSGADSGLQALAPDAPPD